MTDTYNPILSKEDIKRWALLQKRPTPEPGIALVFSGEGQPLIALIQGQMGITRGEMVWGKYNLLYKVDLTEHPLSFQFKLPCATDAFDFQAELKFICSVQEPEKIISRGITDVRLFLEPIMAEIMRNISRNYQVEESADAERDISLKVKRAIYDEGFQVYRFVLTLSLEQEIRDRIREKKRIEDTTEIETNKIKSQKKIEQEAQSLDMQRQLFEMERIKMQEQFEIERIKLKMEFYTPLLQAGNWQMLALQLAQNPQDVVFISQEINKQKQIDRENQMRMLKMLLDEDAIEGSQVSEVGKRVLQGLITMTEEYTRALGSGDSNNTESQKPILETEEPKNNTSDSVRPEFNWDED
ncbi:hypothetical protein [Limnofasciculus baicalensis]|uniref:Band 7 domain-containing protein n=1 Tax=Limnofasciculus baicalensis BBK-W-15 TaxID=2699891 RepID=A0AAE3KM32_9CYAN|nr:hypothetical protein [Limnofasciculus baicalensis]MCP2728356.1 hypothetical protein [Limnofasciculus baicalensis BBK-W-15]